MDINTRAVANRYSNILRNASPEAYASGLDWYRVANGIVLDIASQYGISGYHSAIVVASLSPRTHWSRNIVMAHQLLSGEGVSGLGSAARRGQLALEVGMNAVNPDTAPKIFAFAQNLMGDMQPVTIDAWMLRAAGLPGDLKLKDKGRYATISAIVSRLAHRNDLTPAQCQAIIWVAVRGRAE